MMFLSLKHLFSRKKQSLLILLGIIIGTAAYVAISGMMLGFQTKLMDQLVNNDAHIRISAREELLTVQALNSYSEVAHVFWAIPPSGRKDSAKIEYPIGWFNKLDADPDVLAFAPQVNLNVIFNRARVTQSGRLIGADPKQQEKISNIEQYMIAGKFKDIGTSGNHLVIGKQLLEKLGARLSETILISSGKGGPQPFKVVGIFETGSRNIDEATAFSSLSDTQKLRGSPSEITDIAVKIIDPNEAEEKAMEWKSTTNEKVLAWQESFASILSVFKTQDIVRNSMTISIIIVASFGIYNILSILVAQKKRDIAILRSMGFTPSDIVKLFFNQGLILGVVGGTLGLILGVLICWLMGKIEIDPGRLGSSSGRMIISYDYLIYVKAFAIAICATLFSSILPARAAGKLDPMDIIRSGGQ
jgi:lipoprotein-releasing system permease protein